MIRQKNRKRVPASRADTREFCKPNTMPTETMSVASESRAASTKKATMVINVESNGWQSTDSKAKNEAKRHNSNQMGNLGPHDSSEMKQPVKVSNDFIYNRKETIRVLIFFIIKIYCCHRSNKCKLIGRHFLFHHPNI